MFLETLKDIVTRVEDVEGILLMGIDGLPIEKFVRNESLNVEALSAEFTAVLRGTSQAAHELEVGNIDEIIIVSDKMILLTKSITSEYFLMLILPEGANLGRARFELKKARYILEKEFV